MRVTPKTLTDTMVQDALDRRIIDANLAVESGARLRAGQWHAPPETRTAARQRICDAINARAEREDGGT